VLVVHASTVDRVAAEVYRDRVTESAELVIWSDERADRVLDAAAELLVRWGYQRVTIDDVARHAGIGKGTVYLHFRSKDALFLTVLLRLHHRLVTGLAAGMEADPGRALPSQLMRAAYLAVAADPVQRPLYLGDPELLGRLLHEAAGTLGEITVRRDTLLRDHLALLRDEGCLRADLDLDAQVQVIDAIGAGFFFLDAVPGADPDPVARADLLAHAIAAVLETGRRPSAALAGAVAAGYRHLTDHIRDEARRRSR
jgi:AcrR family transcriptional regulator